MTNNREEIWESTDKNSNKQIMKSSLRRKELSQSDEVVTREHHDSRFILFTKLKNVLNNHISSLPKNEIKITDFMFYKVNKRNNRNEMRTIEECASEYIRQ